MWVDLKDDVVMVLSLKKELVFVKKDRDIVNIAFVNKKKGRAEKLKVNLKTGEEMHDEWVLFWVW